MFNDNAPAVSAHTSRVWVARPTAADVPNYEMAVRQSVHHLAPFAVPDPYDLPAAIAATSPTYQPLLIHASEPQGGHDIVGRVNVVSISYGRSWSATLGYESFVPYARSGLFAEGLRSVLAVCFTPTPEGLGLHRVEANVQPANTRSAGLLRRLGFVREGFSKEFLWMPDHAGDGWLWSDHDRYALLASAWPGSAYPVQSRQRVIAVVVEPDVPADAVASDLAGPMGIELGVPVLRPERHGPQVWSVLREASCGAVIAVSEDYPVSTLEGGLADAGVDVDGVPVLHWSGEAPSRADIVRISLDIAARARGRFGVQPSGMAE